MEESPLIAADEDYLRPTEVLVFSAGDVRQCVDISLIDDDSLEEVEEFFANISTLVPRVTIDPDLTTVELQDDDGTD